MRRFSMKNTLSVLLCVVLIAAMALSMAACGASKEAAAPQAAVSYTVITVDLEGNETKLEITSDKETVGEELLAQGIIAGDMGDYGLYIKTVNGLTLDWDKDAKYWAFYIGEDYAVTGVDLTPAEEGVTYTLRPEG